VSGQLAVTSDYVYRGQTFSDGKPAVQASVTWRPQAAGLDGLHLDGWLSNIDFGDGDPADAEASATLGYELSIGSLSFDTGATYISYLGAPRGGRYDYLELYGAATAPAGEGEVTAAIHIAPRYSGDTGSAVFSDIGITWPLMSGFSVAGAVGHARLDPRAGRDYFYWQVGLSADVRGVTFGLAYHGNDQAGCLNTCDGRVVLTVAKVF
jgi:uncharacterized protein (TIGR02001 family)